jgi:DNA gyrase subunit A
MIFTRSGQCYWLKVWHIPVGARHARGKPIVNLVNMIPTDEVAAVVPVREFSEDCFLFFATRKGLVKKTPLSAYGNIRSVGLNAINIREGDELIGVRVTGGGDEVILGTRNGMAIRFHEGDARAMGRATSGVRGINLAKGDEVVGMVALARPEAALLVVTEGGMGKRTDVEAYRKQQRGGKGVINVKTSDKTGKVIAIKSVAEDDEFMVITRNGVVNRQRVDEIRCIGRATQGVRLVNLDEGDQVVDVARVIQENGNEGVDVEDVADQVMGDSQASSTSDGPGPEAVAEAEEEGAPAVEEEGEPAGEG